MILNNNFQPSCNLPAAWFTFLFGKQINSTSPVNPIHNIEKSVYFYQVIFEKNVAIKIYFTSMANVSMLTVL